MVNAKSRHAEPIIVDFSTDPIFEEFLNAQVKRTTRFTYTTLVKRLCEFTNQTGQQILDDSEKWITKIFEFQKWLLDKGYSPNYTHSCMGMVRGFFSHYRKPLPFSSIEKRKLNKRSRKTSDSAR